MTTRRKFTREFKLKAVELSHQRENMKKLAAAMAEQARKATDEALNGLEERLYAMLGSSETRLSIILNA